MERMGEFVEPEKPPVRELPKDLMGRNRNMFGFMKKHLERAKDTLEQQSNVVIIDETERFFQELRRFKSKPRLLTKSRSTN